ncbi:MAG: hypothetical protein EBV77_10385, partial [Gemmatimonadaceae bacterium]|nr:hypothetical protein [Gemmatimonadaceae bacterium]
WIAGLHDELTSFFGRLDRGGTFTEDRWERPGGGWAMSEIAAATQADAIGVDWHTAPQDARTMTDPFNVALQGNLDPCTLYAPTDEIRRRTHEMIAAFGPVGHVANLGLPDCTTSSRRSSAASIVGARSPRTAGSVRAEAAVWRA